MRKQKETKRRIRKDSSELEAGRGRWNPWGKDNDSDEDENEDTNEEKGKVEDVDRNEEVEGDIKVETNRRRIWMVMAMKKPADGPLLSSGQYVCDEKGEDEEADMEEKGDE